MAAIFAGDESGNLGFAFDKNATTHFVLALVRFENGDFSRQLVERFKAERHLKHRDLSFHELAIHRWSRLVFEFVGTLQFEGWVLVVDKTILPDPHRAFPIPTLYSYIVSEALSHVPYEKRRGAVVILDEIDESGRVLLEIGRILKLRGIHRGFKKLVAKRSRNESLLQIADLVAGATFQSVAKGDGTLLKTIRSKLHFAYFPGNEKPPS